LSSTTGTTTDPTGAKEQFDANLYFSNEFGNQIRIPFPIRMFLSYRVRIPIYAGYKRLFDNAVTTGAPVQPALVEDACAALKALHKID
jgi:hypothetical protein